MRTTKTLLLLGSLILGSSMLAVGCGGTAADASAQSASQAATRAPLQAKVDGRLQLVADAFADVPLRPAQRSEIESLLSAASERQAKMAPIHKDFMSTLADQVERGAIDEAVLQAKVDAGIAAHRPLAAEDRKAAERAHAILDADQRTALVDALEAKRHERFGKFVAAAAGAGGPPDQAKAPDHGPPGPFAMMKELNLTPEQKAKIFEALKAEMPIGAAFGGHDGPPDAEHARHHDEGDEKGHRGWGGKHGGGKLLEAFKSERFVLDELAPQADMEKHLKMGAEHAVRFAKAALPVLTPEQRTTAAKMIRDHADKPGPM